MYRSITRTGTVYEQIHFTNGYSTRTHTVHTSTSIGKVHVQVHYKGRYSTCTGTMYRSITWFPTCPYVMSILLYCGRSTVCTYRMANCKNTKRSGLCIFVYSIVYCTLDNIDHCPARDFWSLNRKLSCQFLSKFVQCEHAEPRKWTRWEVKNLCT